MRIHLKRTAFLGIFVAALSMFSAAPASAQATRTWVSGVGDDVNPCSRTAPCKTFAGAISKTAAGGEINCLDPGGYGTVTITKSLTIDCTGTFGSTLNSGGINGIVINDSLSATPGQAEVILRGLSINGAGSTPGLNGVRFISGRSLVMQDIFIQNQNSGSGISIQPAGSAEFYAENVTITDGNRGILIQPTGANGGMRATLRNVRSWNNSGTALEINTTGNTSAFGTIVAVYDSDFSGSSQGVFVNTLVSTSTAALMLANTQLANNSNQGISAAGPNTTVRVGLSSITGNGTGLLATGGASLLTYSNNRVNGNGTDGAFSGTVAPL